MAWESMSAIALKHAFEDEVLTAYATRKSVSTCGECFCCWDELEGEKRAMSTRGRAEMDERKSSISLVSPASKAVEFGKARVSVVLLGAKVSECCS